MEMTRERARELLAGVAGVTVAPAAAPITVQVLPERWVEAARFAPDAGLTMP